MPELFTKILRKLKKLEGEYLLRPQTQSIFDLADQWDILIILDGCRYDTFQKINFLPGRLQKRYSPETCTADWAERAIPTQAQDIVYLSANPFVSEFYFETWDKPQPFFHLEELWDDGWDDELKTVLPTIVTKRAQALLKKYPDKKHIFHYMQPHHPFIGKQNIAASGWSATRDEALGAKKPRYQENVYELVEQGEISGRKVKTAYEDNLFLVLNALQPLLKEVGSKRTVITADHGNCFGEYGVYSHPSEVYIRELLEVPWFTVEMSQADAAGL